MKLYNPFITLRRTAEDNNAEHAEFPTSITAGAKSGALVQLNPASITVARGGIEGAQWKLADGTNGDVFFLTRQVLDNTYTSVPLDNLVYQPTMQTPALLGEKITGLNTKDAIVEIEGSDYLVLSGDGAIASNTTLNSELTCVGGKLALKSQTIGGYGQTLATVARLIGFAAPTQASDNLRIVVQFGPFPARDRDTVS